MRIRDEYQISWRSLGTALLLGSVCGGVAGFAPVINVTPQQPWIAFIPRTSGTIFTESMHNGAEQAAEDRGYHLYWNAPSREDDVDRQIELATKSVAKGARALILGPTSSTALISTVNSITTAKVPVVIVQADAFISQNSYLTTVSPDQTVFGQLAARRIDTRLDGSGQVAVIGLNRDAPETFARSQAFAQELKHFPHLTIATFRHESSQLTEAEQSASEVLDRFPSIKAIFAVNSVATEGAIFALQQRAPKREIIVVGCDDDLLLRDDLRNGKLDSLIVSDEYSIGYLAAEAAISRARGRPFPVSPPIGVTLLTRETLASYDFR